MSLRAVVRKEFLDAVRTNTLVELTLLFASFAGFLAAIQHVPSIFRDGGVTNTLALLNSMRQPTVFLVPAVGLGLGYAAVAGERERGNLKLALALPNTRGDVLVGKFLGRSAVAAVAVLAAYAAVAVVALATYDSFALDTFAAYTVLTVLYAAVFVAISTGLSAVTPSRARSLGISVGLYALFLLVWDLVLLLLQLAAVGRELPESGLPQWIVFVGLWNPSTAFSFAARAVIPEYYEITVFPETTAVYTQEWVGFAVLAVWTVVPLAVGYRSFTRGDL